MRYQIKKCIFLNITEFIYETKLLYTDLLIYYTNKFYLLII